ncbi:hypothetical protein IGI37_003329 [Enterococcus sp. AZ194]|uniref:immunoglobulin-like domain-containing protein n=1 Tax=Enterococcus sp. AZ194 TaxID=2774629 RepID=UPI003F21FA80
MKSKKLAVVSLLTLIAPTLLNTQTVIAESITNTVEEQPATESVLAETVHSEEAYAEKLSVEEVAEKEQATKEATKETVKETTTSESSQPETASQTEETNATTEREAAPAVQESEEPSASEAPVNEAPVNEAPTNEATPEVAQPEAATSQPAPPEVGIVLPDEPAAANQPRFSGLAAKTIKLGGPFNPLAGVHATDDKDGDLTSKITQTNNVNVNKVGSYKITYSVTNSAGITATKTVDVYVYDEKANGKALKISVKDVTVTDSEDVRAKILAGVKVTKSDGTVADPSTYDIATIGSAGGGVVGNYTVTIVVQDKTTGIVTEATVKVTVIAGVTIKATDKTIYVGQAVDPLSLVTAVDQATGQALGSYDVTKDTGIFYTGAVDTATPGVYTVNYIAKNSTGSVATATANVTVVEASEPTIVASNQTVVAGTKLTDATILGWAKANDVVDGENLAVKEYTVAEGKIDTKAVGSTYTITYSYTNSAGKTGTKVITLTISKYPAPTLKVPAEKVMYVGDVLTEEMILSWAKAENATYVGFVVSSGKILVNKLDNTLVEPGVHTIEYLAANEGRQEVKMTMTLTVLEKPVDEEKPGKEAEKDSEKEQKDSEETTETDKDPKATNNKKTTNNKKATVTQTKAIKKSTKQLPKTGTQNDGQLLSVVGVFAVLAAFFLKRRKQN